MKLMSEADRDRGVYNHVHAAIGELTWVVGPDPDREATFTFDELVAAVCRRCNDPRYGYTVPLVTAEEIRLHLDIETAVGERLEQMYDENIGSDLFEVEPDVFRPGPGYAW